MSTAVIFWLQILSALLYGGAAAQEWTTIRRRGEHSLAPALWLGGSALVLHSVGVAAEVLAGDHLNLDLSYALSLFTWLVVLQFLLAILFLKVELLGLILFPLAAVVLLVEAFAPTGTALRIEVDQPALLGHLVLSLLAYGTLTMAAVQAGLLGCQEGHLRRKRMGLMSRILPPMQPMERLLFHLLRIGFGLLTLVVLSGAVFSEQIFGQPFTFDHKTVLSLIAWAVFGLLLWGHNHYGWRGRTAVRWTLSGYGLLILAYFGVRFILELRA
ncbi:cytochrome C assembly family protein [Thiohalorhabdus sp. Cl-TMA]|uniref:Inner membrane protein YpjD n=1 Tax=Thiohalorhabdus methylotrophus TaxID=3242694 RepID=A0ABV4TZC8_9GAMM